MTCVKMNLDSKIYIAGHTGLVGSAIVRILRENGYKNLIFSTHRDLDLCDEEVTKKFFENIVFIICYFSLYLVIIW